MSGNWKNKILNYEEPPPKGSWDNIVQRLDREDELVKPRFIEKMITYEASPPLGTWDRIVAELDKEDQNESIPSIPLNKLTKKRHIYWSLAAAASVIFIVTSVIWNTDTEKNNGPTAPIANMSSSSSPINSNDIASVDMNTTNNIVVAAYQGKKHNSVVAKAASTVHKTEERSAQTSENILFAQIDPVTVNIPDPLTTDPFYNSKEKILGNDGDYAVNTDMITSADRYVTITGPDGTSKRVSTKLSAYIGFLTDRSPATEEAIDIIIREAVLWKGKLNQWSNKMINNVIAPTLSNYMDVIELSNMLSEKK